jgi:hypothetical protein
MKHALYACLAMLFLTAGFSAPQVSDQDFPLNGARTLRLNVSGSLHLVATPGRTSVGFHVIDNGPSTPPISVKIAHAGSMLNVSITGPSEGFLPFTGASGYELRVEYPPSLKLDVREFAGRLHLDRATAATQLYNADGNIVVDDAPFAITAQADSGDIVVNGARSRLTLSTIEGNVDAELASSWSGTLIRLETQHGNLHLGVPPGFRARYDVTSAAGTVTNPFKSVGKTPLVFILAEQGNITIASL